jgi:cytochrome P450
MTIRLWIKSYQNHVIYCSVYIAIGAACLKSVEASSALDDAFYPLQILQQFVAGVALLLLLTELQFIFKRATLPPGDSGLPILGDLPRMIRRGPRELFLERTQEYGSPCTHNMLMTPSLMVSSDEDVNKWITLERKGKAAASIIPHMKELLGADSIMMTSSKQHRRLRRIFEPSFSPSTVKSYMGIMDTISKAYLEEWSSTGEFYSSKEWSFLAMRLFFACAFGGEVEEEILKRLNRLFCTWVRGTFAIIPFPIPGTTLYNAHQAKRELASVLRGMVHHFKETNPPGTDGATTTMMGRLCYGLDDEGKPLAEKQLIDNIQFILFAGHDTTKGSFCAFVHYLNKFPGIQKMLVKEVQAFSEPLDVDELRNAPLLNAFLAETWRLVPPLGDYVLVATEDVDFKGYKVRKGVQVALSLQGYNVMKEGRYQDPDEFHLGRWLPKEHPLHDPKYFQEGVNFNVMSTKYRAFNMGAHSCLGAHFAKMEARVVLTRLLQSYDIQVTHDRLIKFPLLQYDNHFMLTNTKRAPKHN